jgi:hypothetical protein
LVDWGWRKQKKKKEKKGRQGRPISHLPFFDKKAKVKREGQVHLEGKEKTKRQNRRGPLVVVSIKKQGDG